MYAAPGAFASCNPRAVTLAGVASLRAPEPDGLEFGRFAWADSETGFAANTRTDPTQILGFVLPVWNGNCGIRRTRNSAFIRPGYQVTLCAAGDFWAQFEGGAVRYQQVYARLVDGAPVCGYAADAEPTPWYVVTDAAPGDLAIISTWSYPRT